MKKPEIPQPKEFPPEKQIPYWVEEKLTSPQEQGELWNKLRELIEEYKAFSSEEEPEKFKKEELENKILETAREISKFSSPREQKELEKILEDLGL